MVLIANRYEPTGNASWGGMGEVNECEDRNLSRKVMLKRVFKLSDIPRLMDEQKALIKLRSKHVVQLLDVVRFDWRGTEITCLVLEFISGKDLDKLQFQPDADYHKTLWQIASGIADIHEADVIHRDLNPRNIRRDSNGVIKIFDFGLAREVGVDDKTRSIAGTLGYMAPELFGTKTISFSRAIDTYAFGRTALALLGRQPPNEKAKAISPGTVRAAFPALDADLAKGIEGCLDQSATNRPEMSEVQRLLGRDLLKNKHRARIVNGSTIHELNANQRVVNINSSVGSIRITYDGLKFSVASVTGDVYVNNVRIASGFTMLSACVITIGTAGQNRAFITFDVSNPEIMA
jgi:eukaryotic-like serine/threonine-protein kinase